MISSLTLEGIHLDIRYISWRPDDLVRNAGAVILKVAYGWTVASDDDYFVNLMKKSFALHAEVSGTGRWLVDIFPWLRFTPAWVPGAGFKRIASQYAEQMGLVDLIPFNWAKDQIVSNNI